MIQVTGRVTQAAWMTWVTQLLIQVTCDLGRLFVTWVTRLTWITFRRSRSLSTQVTQRAIQVNIDLGHSLGDLGR